VTKTFRELGVDGALCDALESQGIVHPFPIQELTLPLALGGNDLIGQARTGTGKTLAFGLPLLQQLDPGRATTQALVVVPTRELCVQVHSDLAIGETLGLRTISVYGGTPYEAQIEALTSGVHVVVGTPGRLIDHLNRGNLDLSHVKVLVLDEADEMLDMGFLPDVERLIEATPSNDRHTMLFSATMPTAIVKMARRYLSHPTFTRADAEEHETAPNVTQHFFSVHRMDKPRLLARILQSPNRGGVYVFVRTKHMADRLVNELEDLRIPAIPIHGDLRQAAREKNLDRFREGKATVLVATEVAARGLDVTGVTHVVNYDCPEDQKMYLHRIGRTARAGEAGVAVTFAEFNEVDRLNVIRKAVGATDSEIVPVFSTSDLLTELFDLPEEKPWDHLSRAKKSGDGARDRDHGRDHGRGVDRDRGEDGDGRRSGRRDRDDERGSADRGGRSDRTESAGAASDAAERSERRRGGRQGRTDGKPKSSRRSEGAGSGRDATRARVTREPAEPRSGGADDEDRGARRGSRPDDGGATRARTRTRTRARASEPTGGRGEERGPSAEEADTRGGGTSRNQGEGSGKGQRTRARPSRDRRQGGGRNGGEQGGRQDRDRRSQDRDGGSGDDRDRQEASGRDEERRERAGGDRGGDRSERGGDRSERGGDRSERGGDRSERGGDRGRNQRGKGGRGGRNSGTRKGGDRDSRGRSGDQRDETPVRTEPRGRSARGEGEPQLSRRVKVEHLP
jgi:superfamily II DNA/RNA helicase